jgi:hypothetical protein
LCHGGVQLPDDQQYACDANSKKHLHLNSPQSKRITFIMMPRRKIEVY